MSVNITSRSSSAAASPVALSANSPTSTINGGYSTIVFGTVPVDTNSAYNASTGKFTVPTAGYYMVIGNLLVGGVYALNQQIDGYIFKNSATVLDPFNAHAGGAVVDLNVTFTSLQQYNAGDTIEIQASSNATTPSLTGSNAIYNSMSIHKI